VVHSAGALLAGRGRFEADVEFPLFPGREGEGEAFGSGSGQEERQA